MISDNVRDLQAIGVPNGPTAAIPLINCLDAELRALGYEDVILFRPFSGFSLPGGGPEQTLHDTLRRNGFGGSNSGGIGLDVLAASLDAFVASKGPPATLIIDFASRLVNRSDVLSAPEHALFTRAQIASHSATSRPAGPERRPFYNTVIWISDREADLPDWLTVDNPRIRTISIPSPDGATRKSLAGSLLRILKAGHETSPAEAAAAEETFVNLTDGLLLSDLNSIAQLGRTEGLPITQIADAVRRYKVGVTEDPWQRIDRAKIAGADEYIRRRVKGQEHAVTHLLDIIKRAVTGIGRSGSTGRPRGVAFLAGPTGVGKTELAKTVTSLLFGDDSAYIRFDMSEFSAEHADQRLIGAPPGYVGYDVGGELTNAVREKPFSVILFDEIEKAHPRILDKFLQILDDGVLTSGRGDRVYFSEAIILFTSNLGIYRTGADGERIANVGPDDGQETVSTKVRQEIENHFKLVLNRPEILNRIGENVIVFDFIRRPIAEQIFEQIVSGLLEDTASLAFTLVISDRALQILRELCLKDLTNGGRGIRNMVEAHLANPLARALFDTGATSGAFEISDLIPGAVTSISLTEKSRSP